MGRCRRSSRRNCLPKRGFEGIPKDFAGDIEEVDALRAEDPLWSPVRAVAAFLCKYVSGFV
jgi:hypothetical protein